MRIQLSSNSYSLIPEGTYVFRIEKADYSADYGKLALTLKTQDGQTHVERFAFLKNGKPNDGALSAFSYVARCAMNDMDLDDVDPQDLVGHYMECDVVHEEVESTSKPGEMKTFVKIDKRRPSEGWGESVQAKPQESANNPDDLEALLGNL